MSTIYIKLLDEPVDCWRPVEAEDAGDGRYRIIGPSDPNEEWAFKVGDVVRCERHPDGHLVAVTLANV